MKDEDFADGIYEILRAVDYKLGGGYDPGTGIDYRNDVFETFSFWAHCECTCTYKARERDYEESSGHSEGCYQTLIRNRGFSYGFESTIPWDEQDKINMRATVEVCREMGIDPNLPGRYVHCNCDYHERYDAWRADNDHDETCALEDVGFRHFESGLEVSWYKRVGRSTESNKGTKSLDWFKIVVECLESVRDDE